MPNPADLLKKFNQIVETLNDEKRKEKNRLEYERRDLIVNIGNSIGEIIKPVLDRLADQARINKEDLKEAIKQIQIKPPEVNVSTPDVYVPDIKVPTPQVSVNIPPIKVPEINMPHEMDIKGWVKLQGVDLSNPLPVQIRDKDGKPVNFFENLTTVIAQGGGSGKHDFFTIKGFSASAYAEYLNGDNRLRVSIETGGAGLTDAELRASAVPVSQVSGHRWSTEATQSGTWNITNVTNSISATLLNGDGNSLDPRDRNWTINETLIVSGALDTIKASGVARQTNPTPVSDGDNQRLATDDLGRVLTRPMQVRDLTLTAYASLTNGTETTLASAVAGSYLDLVYIMGANNSDAAATVDLRAATAGNIVMTLQIPANGTAGIACPIPLPQGDTGNNWTADMGDITGTTIYLTALFSKEI